MNSYQLPLILQGYRWLPMGETVQEGDLFVAENQSWQRSSLVGMRIDGNYYYIRKIDEAPPQPPPSQDL